MDLKLTPLKGKTLFNAQHAPFGAFLSFTCGNAATGGGIGVESGRPATQNIFIGVKRGDRRATGTITCLPFVRGIAPVSAAATYVVEQAVQNVTTPSIDCYGEEQIQRLFGWATDSFLTPDLNFSIYTPFAPVPDPASSAEIESLRTALLPAVVATLTVDNRTGTETKTAVFALDFSEPGTRLIEAGDDANAVGFAWRRGMGVLGQLEGGGREGLFAFQRWSVAEGMSDINPIHALGSCGGIGIEVPAGEKRTLVLAIGVYLEGLITTGIEGRYYYTRLYTSLDDVLVTALQRAGELRAQSATLDQKLLASGLSSDQQFMIAHGTRGYYGSTQLLDVAGEPFFVVNEGEYCMMNTLDLSIDHAFWELEQGPWMVKNILNNFSRHYSYHDHVKARGGSKQPGGVSFCHDMGAHNNFSRNGDSSYELPNLHGCFSFMTQEELCNWILLAGCYVAYTGDTQWLLENAHLLAACAESMRHRADPRTGLMSHDSSRCLDGQEITTYDSLDESLGQARSNTYLAVKCWAAWIGLEMLAKLRAAAGGADGDGQLIEPALSDELARFLANSAGADGTIPAVIERDSRGYASRILPAIESLVYPAWWLQCFKSRAVGNSHDDAMQLLNAALDNPLIAVLRRHTLALLKDPQRRNLFADGGIKLSSTSNNSWMSKIALFLYVARELLHLHEEDATIAAMFQAADAAHVRWQTEGSSYWACSDQFVKGIAKASRYYPRIIVAALWLSEITPAARVAGGDRLTSPAATPTSSRA